MQDQMLTKATGFKEALKFPLFHHAHGFTVSQQFVAGGIGTEVIGVKKTQIPRYSALGSEKRSKHGLLNEVGTMVSVQPCFETAGARRPQSVTNRTKTPFLLTTV